MASITWDPINKGPDATLSNGNLTATIPNNRNTVRATEGRTSGKWYWEIYFSEPGNVMVGIVNEFANLSEQNYLSQNARYYYNSNGNKFPENKSYGQTFSKDDVIGIALDLDNGLLEFYKNGVSQGISHTNILSMGKVYPALTSGSSSAGNISTVNFGATPFIYSLPEGYLPYDFENSRYWFSQNKILLLSDNKKILSINYEYNETPIMTSATTPWGEVKSSNHYSSFFPWQAFDGVKDSWASGWLSKGTTNQWILFSFMRPVLIDKYEIYVPNMGTQKDLLPQRFKLEGSNDENSWTILDERICTLDDWIDNKWNEFNIDPDKKGEYKLYRLYCFNNNGGANYIAIPEMRLSGTKAEVIQIPSYTEQDFINYGMEMQELSAVDFTAEFSKKSYIQNQSKSLGSGKVYEQILTTIKPIKNIKVK